MIGTLTLRPILDSDLQLLESWLNKEYILKWYHDADEWLSEIKQRHGDFSFLHHFIVLKEDKPIGFCQYYDCFDAQEEWYDVDERNTMFSMDYLIGEEEYLQKGLGKEIVKMLVNKIRGNLPNVKIVVQPDNDNTASCKSLLSNKFIYNESKEYYILE